MVTECDEALKKGENKRVTQVRKTTRQPIAWEDRDWGGWSGRTYYDENPDDDAYCYQRNGESDVDYEKRLEEEIVKVRKEYEEAVANGTSSYSGATDRYRKPVPPPAFLEIDVLDDNGDFIYEEKEVSAVDGRVFRHEFYSAFVSRMRGRLWEIKKSAEREAGALVESSSTALALRDKKKEVGDAFEKRLKVGHVGTYTGAGEQGRGYDHTGKGREAGRKAADTVPVNEGRAVRPT
jgi:hypothetical protein